MIKSKEANCIKIWPAKILAERRILKVKGRINHLILSIKTKIGRRNKGLPFGAKWERETKIFWERPHIKIPKKKESEIKREKESWEEKAKT